MSDKSHTTIEYISPRSPLKEATSTRNTLRQEDSSNEETQDSSQAKIDRGNAFKSRSSEIYNQLLTIYDGHWQSEEDVTIRAKYLKALGSTLARCSTADSLLKMLEENEEFLASPGRFYAYALPRCSIRAPSLCLSSAAELRSNAMVGIPKWGYLPDHTFRLPAVEMTTDSIIWSSIRGVLEANNLKYVTSSEVVGVPEWSSDTSNEFKCLEQIILRIIELSKSPNSATIRFGKNRSGDDTSIIRNAVDYVYLHNAYFRLRSSYNNLTIAKSVHAIGQRSWRINQGGRMAEKSGGFKLAELIQKTLDSELKAKTPEAEQAFSLFSGILNELGAKCDVLPQSLFDAPSIIVRDDLRRGPTYKNNAGRVVKNYYIPFSFTKSHEFADYPPAIRGELNRLSNESNTLIDTINHLSTVDANILVPNYRETLRLLYSLADTVRKEWRSNLFVPSIETMSRTRINVDLPNGSERDRAIRALDSVDQILKASIRGLVFAPVSSDSAVLDKYRKNIEEIELIRRKRTSALERSRR